MGQNNGQSADMISQVLSFVHPEFSVIIQMIGLSFLERMEELKIKNNGHALNS